MLAFPCTISQLSKYRISTLLYAQWLCTQKETTVVCCQGQKQFDCLTCLWLELFFYFLRLTTLPVVSFLAEENCFSPLQLVVGVDFVFPLEEEEEEEEEGRITLT